MASSDDVCRSELIELVYDGTFNQIHKDIRESLLDPIFDPREGLTATQAGKLAYQRSRAVHSRLESPVEIIENPIRLFALAEWPTLLDVSVFSLLMVHYNLCMGTVLEHGNGRPELDGYVKELSSLSSFGLYMATELGYGNNVAALRTEAVYEPASETFVLNTADPLSQKFMSYSGFQDIPKLAVVLARMRVNDEDCGVFPFVVRISDGDGLCQGVHAMPCPEKPVQGLDNGVTWFDHVRVPRENLLTGVMGELTKDGVFRSAIRNRRKRFLQSMSRIQPGRICVASAAASAGRAAVYIALRYSRQRLTNAPGRNDMPIIEYRSHQVPVFTALAKVYAMTFLINHVKREYLDERHDGVSERLGTLIAITKALVTWEVTDVVTICRERCGAQGIFSVNRIADYGSLLQGLVTAEGDNQVLLANAAGQLLAQPVQDPLVALDDPVCRSIHDWEFHRDLLRFREFSLRDAVREVMADDSRTYFSSWNENLGSALAMARLRGVGLALERFAAAAAAADQMREALSLLTTLYGLTELHRDSGWYLAKRALTADQVEGIPSAIESLCARILPHVPVLIDGFNLSPELIRAPIAADDYVAAFERLAGARPSGHEVAGGE